MISTGGADHAIFQWRFIPEGGLDSQSATASTVADVGDSYDEASDSDLSDVDPVDSDIEQVCLCFGCGMSIFECNRNQKRAPIIFFKAFRVYEAVN